MFLYFWLPSFSGRTSEALPSTTTFNLEAVAVDVWPRAGHPRELFSGDDQFFEGVRTRTLELNRADNPYPELTVTRALVSAAELRFRVGPRLANYIASAGLSLTARALEDLQRSHYGHIRLHGETLRTLIEAVAERRSEEGAIPLPETGQLSLWREESVFPKLRAFWLHS